jgi:hypothetical protein
MNSNGLATLSSIKSVVLIKGLKLQDGDLDV